MRAFACPRCRALVFFENSSCVTCGAALAYDRSAGRFVELFATQGGERSNVDGDRVLRRCANQRVAECNWAQDLAPGALCDCCALTRIRPADSDTNAMAAFARTEAAKRRLLFELDFLELPTVGRDSDSERGLAFDLLSSAAGPVTTGHADGVITLDLAEGDDLHREAMRISLDEPYRTLLGHLRHEIGHWYWDVLVAGTSALPAFRELFGDEQQDYQRALSTHYAKAAAAGVRRDHHVSHYATAHPWEDWAETFAHYLHIRDTLQTAASWGLLVSGPDLDLSVDSNAALTSVPVDQPDSFAEIVAAWLPLSYALNAMNRSMGKEDLYPFVLASTVQRKLRFVHLLVTAGER